MQQRPLLYLDHILESVEYIKTDLAGMDKTLFLADRRTRQLVERNLERISEASRKVPSELKAAEPDIPWQEIAGIGNILRHDYHRVDPELLWETCQKDLSALESAVRRLRDKVA